MTARRPLYVFFLVPAVAAWAAAGTFIVADPRPFPSVEAAASGEAKANWLDFHPILTCGLARLVLQYHGVAFRVAPHI